MGNENKRWLAQKDSPTPRNPKPKEVT